MYSACQGVIQTPPFFRNVSKWKFSVYELGVSLFISANMTELDDDYGIQHEYIDFRTCLEWESCD